MAEQIILHRVFKVFGDNPQKAMELVQKGKTKSDVLAKTGQSIGVFDVNLSINEGEIFVIMGLSGSGKSTLVRMLNGLIKPTSGKIEINGENIAEIHERRLRQLRRKDISMVFQSFALMPHMTVAENASFGLELEGVSLAKRQEAAQEALELVGLAEWGDKYPDELSGGMQQRVGLARALAADPSILLMDEAFSALDPIIRTEMQGELLRLQELKRRTIVFISHDLDESMRLGDRIAIMKDGGVVQIGTPEEVLRHPANDYVRQFISGVDASAVFKAGGIARRTAIEIVSEPSGRGCRMALQILGENDRLFGVVVSAKRHYYGMVSVDSLREAIEGQNGPVPIKNAFLPGSDVTVNANESVGDLLSHVAQALHASPVVNDSGRYVGAITKTTLLRFLDKNTSY
ncbi:MAG: glycine betaine/L-proline ABC transporter ATP-binding protein ProV [Saezia sp.]